MSALAPLEALYDAATGSPLPLPPELATLYGQLAFPRRPGRPYVIGNVVTTLDGVVSLDVPGQEGGGDISGFNRHDQMVMGLLRAVADAVIVGAGTLRVSPQHRWTADSIYPPLAAAYRLLRTSLGKPEPPLTVIVTARGAIDLDLPAYQSGEIPALVVTTSMGARLIQDRGLPSSVQVTVVDSPGSLGVGAILDAVSRARDSGVILVESGPHLMGDFIAEQKLDELFLTLAPQIAGRDDSNERPGLVAGARFAPERPRWGTLVGVKRAASHLFLRYSFETTR